MSPKNDTVPKIAIIVMHASVSEATPDSPQNANTILETSWKIATTIEGQLFSKFLFPCIVPKNLAIAETFESTSTAIFNVSAPAKNATTDTTVLVAKDIPLETFRFVWIAIFLCR